MFSAFHALWFRKELNVSTINMRINIPVRHRTHRQTNLFIKLRARMVTIVYKTDLLLVFLFVMVFGMIFHYLTWIYEPPDLMNTDISYSRQQALIREWKRKKQQETEERLRHSDVDDRYDVESHLKDFAPGFDNGAVRGPNSRRKERIVGDVLEYGFDGGNVEQNGDKFPAENALQNLQPDLALEDLNKQRLSDLEIKRKSQQGSQNQLDMNLNEQEKQVHSRMNILQNDHLVRNSKEEMLRDISHSVVRKHMEDLNMDSLFQPDNRTNYKWNHKKRNRYVKITTPRPDADLHQVFADQHPGNKENVNQTAIDKFMADIDQESEHVIEMKQNEREQWLDDQAEALYKLVFHKDPKPIQNKDLNISAPIGGKLQGGRAQCVLYDVTGQINETYKCIPMAIKPKVTVCLYPPEMDIHISKHILEDGVWEPHIVKEFQNILFSNPDYCFIDIGANIGVYSLIAAEMGHPVVAVEPYIHNLEHFHKAVQIGGLADKITLLRNAIYEKRLNHLRLNLNQRNQGGIDVNPDRKEPCLAPTCTNTVKAIHMDDLLEVINFRKAVIKIDIEGFEHRAFVHSSKLFDQVFISHIIMEWIILRGYYGSELDYSEDKKLVHKLVNMLFDRGFRPFSLVTGIELKQAYWFGWPDDIIWKNDLEDFN